MFVRYLLCAAFIAFTPLIARADIEAAAAIIEQSGVSAGFFVHLGAGDGRLTESFLREMFFGYYGVDQGTVVVPVFGRGRALEEIPATQLNESLIEGLTVYLCGACSCQVKERNPGFDLLIATDWERELFGDQPPPRDQPQRALRRQGDQPPRLLEIPPGKSSQP